MSNLIPFRIRDFLRPYPPFDRMEEAALLTLSHQVKVLFFNSQEHIVPEQGELQGLCLLLHEGAVSVLAAGNEDRGLTDKLQAGDWLYCSAIGVAPSAKLDYVAAEDCLLYGFPSDLLVQMLPRPKAEEIASNPDFFALQRVTPQRKLVACSPELPLGEAARLMRHAGVGSVVVTDDRGLPVGILTDKDLRNKVATGEVPIQTTVAHIMSSPVVCAPPDTNFATLQMLMIEHRIGHLCITADGSPHTTAQGVVSEHDLLRQQSLHPLALAKGLNRAVDIDELAELRGQIDQLAAGYLAGGISVAVVAQMVTMLNDKLLERWLQLVTADMQAEGLGSPPCAFCWLALGSQGRSEQILRTDQDNALVYADVPESDAARVQTYFQSLAKRTVAGLIRCGFEACPADMMASNPKWCQPLQHWEQQFTDWIFHPTPEKILLSNIFFDFRPIAGTLDLAEKLSLHISQTIRQQTIFLSFLAQDALKNPPPLTFFRNFVLEKSAEHKDQFDVKLRALMPLTDAARLLYLATFSDKRLSNTLERFRFLADNDPANRDTYVQAAEAYQTLLHFRNTAGLANQDSGRFFAPKELSNMERLSLKNCFQAIREIQQLIHVRFQLAFFS